MAALNYKHLHYFWVVAKTGGIARAGERLHLTAQTISGQIGLFEDSLGYKLFNRVGRKLEAKFQWQHARDNKPEPEDLKRIEDKILNGLPDEKPVTPAENAAGQSNG